jgi:hypothetical protein
MFCYLWQDKKTIKPYIGFAGGIHLKHPKLVLGDRALIKILPIDPELDLKVDILKEVFQEAVSAKVKKP